MFQTIGNYLNSLFQVNKSEDESEDKLTMQKDKLKLTKRERKWLMKMTQTENMYKVFDSKHYSIEESTEQFIDSIFNKFGIVIVIEDQKGNLFGGFIRFRVIRWKTKFLAAVDYHGEYKVSSFIYRMRTKREKNIELFQMRNRNDIHDFDISLTDNILFQFGTNDIVVWKEEKRFTCSIGQETYDYRGETNALLGNDPTYDYKLIEIKQINDYHAMVYEKISPYLQGKEKAWLKKATQKIKR